MSLTSVLEPTNIPNAPFTKAPKNKTRVTFASWPPELRDEEMVAVHRIIARQFAGDFDCPEKWETMRAMFRASPASEKSAIDSYETFGINIFQMKNRSPGFSTAKPTMLEDMDGQAHF